MFAPGNLLQATQSKTDYIFHGKLLSREAETVLQVFRKQKEKTAEMIAVVYMKEYWTMNERVIHAVERK